MASSLADHLTPGGTALIVHSSLCGEQATLDGLRRAGLEPAIEARQPGPLGGALQFVTDALVNAQSNLVFGDFVDHYFLPPVAPVLPTFLRSTSPV